MKPGPLRKLRRSGDKGLIGGVCAGIGAWMGLDPALIRIVMVILAIVTGGLGILLYGMLWVIMPLGQDQSADAARSVTRKQPARSPWMFGAGVGLVTLGLLFVFREVGIWWSDQLTWPLVLAAAGTALVWLQFSTTRASRSKRNDAAGATVARRRSRIGRLRGAFGIALLLGGAVLFLYINGVLSAGGQVALAGLTVVIVISLVAAPLWVRSSRELNAERTERIRSEERAEVAAHLHDSVLQTLALIQKNPEDSRRISTLARSQERELRDWLSGKTESERADSLAEALKDVAAEVEERHEVPIDAVTVGDRPLDENGLALVAASREAMTNAARHAGSAGPVRLYAEIENGRAEVFVHDRGPGFDPDSVPDDRRGVRDSIIGRMEAHGGNAEIRSAPGEGTEVELTMETK